ncbi:MAG: FAD-dependent oxidoreductase [Pseudomonadota bacterium]
MRQVETIIVGLGLAGATLALMLRHRRRDIAVISDGNAGASQAAAGLITPVIGKNLKPVPRFGQWLSAAIEHYRAEERTYDIAILHRQHARRLLTTSKEQCVWDKRSKLGLPFARPTGDANDIWPQPLAAGQWLTLAPCYRLNVARYLQHVTAQLHQDNALIESSLIDADIDVENGGITIDSLQLRARQLVFCRGAADQTNPWFDALHWRCANGEVIELRTPKTLVQRIHAEGYWLTPIDARRALFGATYNWESPTSTPSTAAREVLRQSFSKLFGFDPDICDQRAGTRPIVAGRRPVLAQAPAHDNLYLFNGLGSRGALTAPGLALALTNHLLDGDRLPPQFGLDNR